MAVSATGLVMSGGGSSRKSFKSCWMAINNPLRSFPEGDLFFNIPTLPVIPGYAALRFEYVALSKNLLVNEPISMLSVKIPKRPSILTNNC